MSEDTKGKQDEQKHDEVVIDTKSFKTNIDTINDLISKASIDLYGTDKKKDEVDDLNKRFNKILSYDLDQLTNKDNNDITSFLSQIISADKKMNAKNNILNNQFMGLSGDEYSTMQSFIYDAYRNRLLEQHDLHEVASQLIELSEAILITRDAIISADVVDGRMERTLDFSSAIDEGNISFTNMVESVEKKFHLLEKIKDFIVPKTLEYGTYYVYIIPYSKIFNDFSVVKGSSKYRSLSTSFGESVSLMESFDNDVQNLAKGKKESGFTEFIESTYAEYIESEDKPSVTKEDFSKDMKTILSNISVCNTPVPIPVTEEGIDSINTFRESFVNESGDKFVDRNVFTEEIHKPSVGNDLFNQIANGTDGGVMMDNDSSNKKENFDDIRDCYIRMMDPTRVIPIEIMDTTIGYYYVQDEDITPISGAVSSTLYYTKFEQNRREKTVIDAIAAQVVKSFDKKFLYNNLKFKKTIVDCISYYNLNEKKLKFQFIPVEYMQEFAIDRDVNGHGQSMIKKSLFYAKLYLMLLLFKIMTIIMNSNDTKVNYLRSSGINKNLANKVQEIARIRQSRQINIADLFSYTTLINKVGNGSEMYLPTGQSGERLLETEILQGQDVQLNSDLLEMLKNAYILASGVPAAIVNYMNEADFAKQIEQNHSKFNGRVVNYQLDLNPCITEMYKKILRYSSNLKESDICELKWAFKPPKTVSNNTKTEMIQQFESFKEFAVKTMYGDQQNNGMEMQDVSREASIQEFTILLVKEFLPTIDVDKLKQLMKEADILAKKKALKPNPALGDSGTDSFDDMMSDNGMGGI